MISRLFKTSLATLGLGTVVLGLATRPAEAVPSFASQTGQACVACHVGGFGPQLTPFGIAFKMTGYTLQGGSGLASEIPIAAMVMTDFTHTVKDQGAPAATHYGTNNNFSPDDQVSLFYGGRITDFMGALAQVTYSGPNNAVYWDNSDFRAVVTKEIGSHDVVFGADLNNNPTVQDAYNTLYAWGFPYISSSLSLTPAATPMVSQLGGSVVGVSLYTWVDQNWYAEIGGYRTLGYSDLRRIGNNLPSPGGIDGVAPYVRVAREWTWSSQLAEVGGMFFEAPLNEVGNGLPGSNRYVDYSIDASWQFLGSGKHAFSVNANLLNEQQYLNASYSAGAASKDYHQLTQFRIVGAYNYMQTYGASLGYQQTWGTKDALLYAPGQDSGSANGSPNSQAVIAQVDWTPFGKPDSWGAPFANVRVGLQYIYYPQFNGGNANYDGFGRSASGNNTLYAFAWFAF